MNAETTERGRENTEPRRYWSPYVAGLGLGLTLIAAFCILGTGLGASAAIARLAAWLEGLALPAHVRETPYFGAWFEPGAGHVLGYYLVFMGIGIFIGGFLSASASGRVTSTVERGRTTPAFDRLAMALFGGVLVGFASRLARGCTSGQALTGTALLLSGSVLFLICVFAGGYAAAYFVRRQWQ